MDQQGDMQDVADEGNTPPAMEEENLPNYFEVGEIALTEKMIEMIKNATLGDAHDNLDPEYRHRLRNPPEEPLALEDPDLRLSVDIYLCTQNASQAQETYNAVRDSIRRRYPDNQMLSFDQVIAAFKSAMLILFPDARQGWTSLPDDAGSELWWDRLRGILDSFVAS